MNEYIAVVLVLAVFFTIIWNYRLEKKSSKNKLPPSPIDKDYRKSPQGIISEILKSLK